MAHRTDREADPDPDGRGHQDAGTRALAARIRCDGVPHHAGPMRQVKLATTRVVTRAW